MKKIILQVNKKLIVITVLFIIVLFSVASTAPLKHNNLYKNLKILPKDISEAAMDEIMDIQFGDALGVKCDYCHAKDAGATDLNYASDANSKKDIAREMMTMVLQLNKINFQVKKPLIGDSLMVVNCYTCHHGATFPDTKNSTPAAHDFMTPPPKQ